MQASPFFSINGLSVQFKTRNGIVDALRDVSFSIGKGQVIGVVGESGSGKSVTAYSVLGLLDRVGKISGGTITFDGIPLANAPDKLLKDIRGREISMIFQNPRAALNPIRPIGKQIADVLIEHAQATQATARGKAVEMLRTVKIADPERRYWAYPYELSGGMCQRVVIAMALACNPRLLIADEPTTGLDVITQKATMDLIQTLTQTRDMSVMLITHDLGLAAQYCDHIVVMQQGKVVEAAPVDTLFKHPQHPYTQALITASPGPSSKLADLTPHQSHAETPAQLKVQPKTQRVAEAQNRDLLEVVNLVKAFPAQTSKIARPWKQKNKHAADFLAVNQVSFRIKRGESLGLVGQSGSGKSTTSSIITRLLDPTSGDIIFDGENITQYPAAKFTHLPQRANIQMVFQDPTDSLNPRFSAFDSIAQPLIHLKKLTQRQSLQQKVEQLADWVDLPRALLSRFPHQLSGGQKARVGIARAIAVDPLLLILDEPTSALDVSVQAVILNLLHRLKQQMDISYLFVSHDLNVVRLMCERVIVMNQGQIVEAGPSDQVLSHPQADYTRALVEAIPHFTPNPV